LGNAQHECAGDMPVSGDVMSFGIGQGVFFEVFKQANRSAPRIPMYRVA
jgi:hypothetical protein